MSGNSSPTGGTSPADRRRSPRHPILQRCFARPVRLSRPRPGDDRPEGWRCIAYDVSASGIGVALPFCPPAGTVLEIEPWELPGVGPLAVRVVHARPLEHLWLCGCECEVPMTPGELRGWLAGAAALGLAAAAATAG